MMNHLACFSIALFSTLLGQQSTVVAVGEGFIEPPSISSSGGNLSISLHLVLATHTVPGYSFTTRLFNGSLPGPTIRLKPGDFLEIDFWNDLPANSDNCDQMYVHNRISAPDETNLHLHGLHISGELPSDDTTLVLKPGENYRYKIQIPMDHMPGTHWMHPHRHGSSALQTGGGAVAAVIIEDPANSSLPEDMQLAREFVMIVTPVRIEDLENVAVEARDNRLQILEAPNNPTFAVNGRIGPKIPMVAEEWIRLRIINAEWASDIVTYQLPGCEMQLIAKDGIYLPEIPRPISSAPVAAGGRADIMVRCPTSSTSFELMAGAVGTRQAAEIPMAGIATFVTSEIVIANTTELEPYRPVFPSYLQNLQTTPPSADCTCSTRLDRGSVNGVPFELDTYIHTTYLGAVVERELRGRQHPYHQHVYPFQLVGGFEPTEYNQYGDWHDTFTSDEGTPIVRYQPTDFDGKVMLHCHRLVHEDEGMMAMEFVHNSTDTSLCACDVFAKCQNHAIFPVQNAGSSKSTLSDDSASSENIWSLFPWLTSTLLIWWRNWD